LSLPALDYSAPSVSVRLDRTRESGGLPRDDAPVD